MAYTAHFPISSFLDVDGKPLENGYVYIGTAGLDPVGNPITVYWDAAATQVAAQPIRTIGGYPSNNGVRSRLYVAATDYSIKVTNVNGTDTVPVALYNAEDAYAADIIFLQAGSGAVPRTVESKLRDTVSVKDFGAVGDGVADDTAAIQSAEDACATSGQALWFPAGTYRCNSGIIKKSVNWQGAGQKKTILDYRGNSVFINATGTSPNRVMCTMSDIGLNGTNAGNASIGITLGWNQRSTPMVRVNIVGFGHYGIYFNDQNWIVDFYDVIVEFCGNRTNNSSGIYKDPAVTGSTWNDIGFYNLNVEACGSASSVAGGIRIISNTANRGLYFYGADVEGNFGTSEIYISNMADCQFINLYMEVVSAQALNAVELYGVNGGFSGGYITGDNAAVNVDGIKIRPGAGFILNEIQLDKITIRNFINSINAESAKVWTGQIYSDAPLVLADPSTSAQWFGNFAPRVSAVKNAIQSIPSGAFTKVTFETEVYDLTKSFSSSTFKPQTIGTYQINASVAWDSAADQDRLIIAVYKRGGEFKSFVARASGTGEQSVQISCQLETDLIDDPIEIYVRQDSGIARDIQANTAKTYFMASLIGRTST